MNKKLIVFSLMILISMSFVFAYSLTDVLSGRVSLVDLILGRAVYSTGNECVDTDSSNYYTIGITTSNESGRFFNYSDQCMTDTILREYYCASTGEASAKQYECLNGCENGACKQNLTPINQCKDTDSSNYYTKGITESTESGRFFNYSDECVTDTILREYYCASTGEASAKQYMCTEGCSDGACKTVTSNIILNKCIDSDGGRYNYTAKGTAYSTESGKNYTHTDECVTNNLLREYYCSSNGEASADAYTCANGCENGACKKVTTTNMTLNVTTNVTSTSMMPTINLTNEIQYSCIDSDNDKNYYIKGVAVVCLGEVCETHSDFCSGGASGKELNEKYCTKLPTVRGLPNGTSYAGVIYDCPYGCSDGACLGQSTVNTTTNLTNINNEAQQSNITCYDSSVIGDANNDGSITPGDALLIANVAMGIELRPSNICCIDIDYNGNINLNDTELALNYYLGKEPFENAGKKCTDAMGFFERITNWFTNLFT